MENQSASTSSSSLMKVVIGLWVGVGLGLAIIAVLVYTGVIPLLANTGSAPAAVPQEAPTANLETAGIHLPEIALADLDGNEVLPSAYRGKLVVMNFWATWCGPCVQEMPMFQEYQDLYPEIAILGVNQEESAQTVKDFLSNIPLDYQFLLDTKGKMAREFHITFLPTTIIADETGQIRFRHYGIMSREQMDHYLETLGQTLQ